RCPQTVTDVLTQNCHRSPARWHRRVSDDAPTLGHTYDIPGRAGLIAGPAGKKGMQPEGCGRRSSASPSPSYGRGSGPARLKSDVPVVVRPGQTRHVRRLVRQPRHVSQGGPVADAVLGDHAERTVRLERD